MDRDSGQLVIKALDCLARRATVTAQNIANAGTPAYRPLRVTFERALAEASARGAEAIGAVEPSIQRVPAGSAEAGLRPDLELATASATALRYGALVDLLNGQMQLEALAVNGVNGHAGDGDKPLGARRRMAQAGGDRRQPRECRQRGD